MDIKKSIYIVSISLYLSKSRNHFSQFIHHSISESISKSIISERHCQQRSRLCGRLERCGHSPAWGSRRTCPLCQVQYMHINNDLTEGDSAFCQPEETLLTEASTYMYMYVQFAICVYLPIQHYRDTL